MAKGGAWRRGACVVKGGMCVKRGACVVCTPRDTAGHCAGGTHPTGMHSCFVFFLQNPTDVSYQLN